MDISVKDWRRDVQNTRKGYFTLVLYGIEIRSCILHKHQSGSIWVAYPAVNYAVDGPPKFASAVVITDDRLKEAIRARVTELLGPGVAND